jgi:hypothetical protein
MQKFAKERTEAIFNEFVALVKKYTKGSYQQIYTVDEELYNKSDQRIDFMSNLYREIINHCVSKLSEYETERDRRS